jgi:hypothetical protein
MRNIQNAWSRLLEHLLVQPVVERVDEQEAAIRLGLINELKATQQRCQENCDQLAELTARMSHLENRLLSYYRERWDAIDRLADYLATAEVPGDYAEFGVYQGMTFNYAYRIMTTISATMRFVAADSFEGLPSPKGIDALDGYTSNFHVGQFACSEPEFRQKLNGLEVDWQRIVILKGWFADTLTGPTAQSHRINQLAAAWIDCDLFSSTVPVLKFITPLLSIGSVVLFDDWRCFRNLPNRGQQRACHDWLEANPQIALRELMSFGFGGLAFTVSAC